MKGHIGVDTVLEQTTVSAMGEGRAGWGVQGNLRMALQYLGPEAGVGARQEGPRRRSSIPSIPPASLSVQTPPNTSPNPDTDHVPDN